MKPLVISILVVMGVGLAAIGLVFAILDTADFVAAAWGASVSTAVGVASLVLKKPAPVATPMGSVRSILTSQVLTLVTRAAALLLGGFAMKHLGLDPFAYVFSFFGCYVAQQVVEMRFVLAQQARVKYEVAQ